MSLRPQNPLLPVLNDNTWVARAAFSGGTPYLLLRDRLGAVFADADFAGLYALRATINERVARVADFLPT